MSATCYMINHYILKMDFCSQWNVMPWLLLWKLWMAIKSLPIGKFYKNHGDCISKVYRQVYLTFIAVSLFAWYTVCIIFLLYQFPQVIFLIIIRDISVLMNCPQSDFTHLSLTRDVLEALQCSFSVFDLKPTKPKSEL